MVTKSTLIFLCSGAPYDVLIAEHIDDTINCARETLSKAGLTSHDLERIVWVGGPTHYKPLRDKSCL